MQTEKVLEPHQQRVISEKVELDLKRDKLTAFVKGNIFQSVSLDEQQRLVRQLSIMNEYSFVLTERIEHF